MYNWILESKPNIAKTAKNDYGPESNFRIQPKHPYVF